MRAALKKKVEQAKKLFRDFTGHAAEHTDLVSVPNYDVGIVVGECDGILYTTVRDGKVEPYIHRFKKKARPLLVASHDGKALFLIDGAYQFTERGIVDK